ncbi:hypothetical protein KIN20_001685 [Parelaphostrongylus tenuis]|uniref:Uncharacterized protein n=1 Tax=Parelaphostrongylus tenuis TaxID=148309 RepID=A0AAD5LUG5_PARTN|nr:hypothetical protein KIN20_001685 [Parelaphostrongylus tenuis]
MDAQTKPILQFAVLQVRIGTRYTDNLQDHRPCKGSKMYVQVNSASVRSTAIGPATSTPPQSHPVLRRRKVACHQIDKEEADRTGLGVSRSSAVQPRLVAVWLSPLAVAGALSEQEKKDINHCVGD